jgi:hypothetical protein
MLPLKKGSRVNNGGGYKKPSTEWQSAVSKPRVSKYIVVGFIPSLEVCI